MQEVRHTMKTMNCRKIESSLPDLLLDPKQVKPEVLAHLEACPACQAELDGLIATMRVMDEWAVPEPTPYFNTKMQARLREAKAAEPESFWESLRSRLLFTSNFHFRTVGAAALAGILAIGGGSAIYVSQTPTPAPQVQASATVRDLQSLDGNAQVFQQLNALDSDDSDSGNNSN
jgi:anti-sigma factor RsiW